ncbi:MAG: hypothetical protein NTY35_11000 [Planctomycetota bacterium]|nr:hypothetical protein [Planctomycetota bacterium]
MKHILLCGVAALILGLLLLRMRGHVNSASSTSWSGSQAAARGEPETTGPDLLLDPATDISRSDVAAQPDLPADSADLDLAGLLAAIARAEAAGDERSLEGLLVRIVGDRSRLQDVLAFLESDEGQTSAVERRGGVVAIAVAFARWSRGDGPEGLDGPGFCEAVLQSLPRQPRESRELLIGFLVGTDHGEVPAIPGRMLPAILSLCRQHPDEAASYARLLDRLGQDPRALADHRGELMSLILEGQDEPLVGPALRALLALDPSSGAATARSLLDGAPPGSALQKLLVKSIAVSAPAAIAVEVLVAASDGSDFAAYAELARRPEAREELRNRYNALVAANLDARARRNLVASMSREETGTLLGIGGTDPHLEVRRQAFLTASVSRDIGLEGLRSIRDAYARRAAQGGIDARCAVLSASNVALRSTGPARDEALGLLGDIARDASLSSFERQLALSKLRPHVPRESLADLEALEPGGSQAGK